jgi:hypothetical protein
MLKMVASSTFSPNLGLESSLVMPHEYEQLPKGWLTMWSGEVDGVRGGCVCG